MKINVESSPDDVRIELVPLIDVIFCILTFFILAAVGITRQQAISVDLPKASTGTPQMREILMVSLDDFGQVYVEQQKMDSKDQLFQSLNNYRATNPSGMMVLYAPSTASYNQVVQVLDLLREVGGDRVALATLPGPGEQPPAANTQPSPIPGIPGATPNPGTPYNPSSTPNSATPYNPYSTPNPSTPYNPTQPVQPGTLPTNPGSTSPSGTDFPNPNEPTKK